MHISRHTRTWLLAAALAGAAHCTSGPPPPADSRPYAEQVMAARAQKDADFRAPKNPYSPVPVGERAQFPGINYYAIAPDYRVAAALTTVPTNPPVIIALADSSHELQQKVKVGTLGFTLAGQTYQLSAFAESVGNVQRLWVPFRDLTSGIETYGGGRYLDLDRTATGYYDLDFNKAYHPSCVYDASWVCPYPPSENRLPVAVRAGERLPGSSTAQ